jgi:hypothetical protein
MKRPTVGNDGAAAAPRFRLFLNVRPEQPKAVVSFEPESEQKKGLAEDRCVEGSDRCGTSTSLNC